MTYWNYKFISKENILLGEDVFPHLIPKDSYIYFWNKKFQIRHYDVYNGDDEDVKWTVFGYEVDNDIDEIQINRENILNDIL